MIKEVKKILTSAFESVGTWKGGNFRTFLVRAEAILNNRPIAFGEDGDIIAPIHFLQPSAQIGIGPPLGAPNIASLLQVKQAEKVMWQKFVKYYLPTISANQVLGEIRDQDLQPGDRVLLKEGSNPLVDTWVPATILRTYPSEKDQIVWNVLVETENGSFVRGITRIAILDGPILGQRKALPAPLGGKCKVWGVGILRIPIRSSKRDLPDRPVTGNEDRERPLRRHTTSENKTGPRRPYNRR